MINFIQGMLVMYTLGFVLLYYITDPLDEENDPNAPLRFAMLWPIAALECLYAMLRGERNDDGTGTN